MALNDLTGQNIQDTYQKVVQTDGTSLADGTGSLLPISFDGNDITISGSLTANEYIVSSSVTNITIATLSGSTTFGDSADDTHTFKGNITTSGNISASGDVYTTNIVMKDGGAIHPGTTNGTITFRNNAHGSADWAHISDDAFRVYMDGVNAFDITPAGMGLNASSRDIDVKIYYDDGIRAFHSNAATNTVKLRDYVGIGGVLDTDNVTDALLVVGTTQLSGSVQTSGPNGHITSSGNISASGDLEIRNITASGTISASNIYVDASTLYVGGVSINKTLVSNIKRGFASDSDSDSEGGYGSDVARINKISTNRVKSTQITSSGNISSSATVTGKIGTFTAITNVNTTHVTASGDISSSGTITGDTVTGNIVSTVGGFGNYRTISSDQTIPADFNAVLYVSTHNPTIKISAGIDYIISAGADVAITKMY